MKEIKKITQIWEIGFARLDKKFIEATSLDDALQRARDWTQEEFDKEKALVKKHKTEFDEQQFADDSDVESVSLFVETDI